MRSFLYHVNVANGLPDVAVHMSFSTVPATIVVPSSYPVTISLEGGSARSNKHSYNRLITVWLSTHYESLTFAIIPHMI